MQLTRLHLYDALSPLASSAAAYAALTASSKLHELSVNGFRSSLPPSAWQCMLSAGKQLPHLEELRLIAGTDQPALGVADACSLVRCCPKLRELLVPGLNGEPADVLAPLCSLTGLQDLQLDNYWVDDAALQVLAQLTVLTCLIVETGVSSGATAAGLLHLTRLTQLQGGCLSVPVPGSLYETLGTDTVSHGEVSVNHHPQSSVCCRSTS